MNRIFKLAAVALAATSLQGNASAQGFYKDIFMDGGINVTSRQDLPASRFLGLSIEAYYSAKHSPMQLTMKDTIEQTTKMVHSDIDENGCLLYPDGAPRFRMIYMNGGRAKSHGRSLTPAGRQHIRDFVANGGSYVGTCAGAFLASMKASSQKTVDYVEEYFRFYPAVAHSSGLDADSTGMRLPATSPLLKYYDFGGDNYIADVYHNGGCYLIENDPVYFAPGTEVLCYYDFPEGDKKRAEEGLEPLTGKVSGWAYVPSKTSGRIVVLGSHPEGVNFGERLEMMSAMCRYAIDGNAAPKVKAELKKGEIRQMTKDTKDNDPAFTKIGDKQYHHFVVNIPKGAKNVKVKLFTTKDYIDFNLAMNKDDFAFTKTAKFKNVTLGGSKTLEVGNIEAGKWYIGVECATTVEEIPTDYGTAYAGKLEVLNGIPYTIQVSWE